MFDQYVVKYGAYFKSKKLKSFLSNSEFCKEFEHVIPGTLSASNKCTHDNGLYVFDVF